MFEEKKKFTSSPTPTPTPHSSFASSPVRVALTHDIRYTQELSIFGKPAAEITQPVTLLFLTMVFRRHQNNHGNSLLHCPICDKAFFRDDLLARHLTKQYETPLLTKLKSVS